MQLGLPPELFTLEPPRSESLGAEAAEGRSEGRFEASAAPSWTWTKGSAGGGGSAQGEAAAEGRSERTLRVLPRREVTCASVTGWSRQRPTLGIVPTGWAPPQTFVCSERRPGETAQAASPDALPGSREEWLNKAAHAVTRAAKPCGRGLLVTLPYSLHSS